MNPYDVIILGSGIAGSTQHWSEPEPRPYRPSSEPNCLARISKRVSLNSRGTPRKECVDDGGHSEKER